jgi:ubiquitination network signaling protein AcrB
VPTPQPVIRPQSPTTTYKTSIKTTQIELDQQKAEFKQKRKEHKNQIGSIRKEVEHLISRLASSGNGDDRQRQRILQIKQNIRQAEEAEAMVTSQIEAMGDIPEEDLRVWNDKKESKSAAKRRLSKSRYELQELKAAGESELATVLAESAQVNQKCEKFQTRQTKLKEQHDRITTANEKGLNERERREEESRAKFIERSFEYKKLEDSIALCGSRLEELQNWKYAMETSILAHEEAFMRGHMPNPSVPQTPEGIIPNSMPPNSGSLSQHTPGFPQFSLLSFPSNSTLQPGFHHQQSSGSQPSFFTEGMRGRSDSMLSSGSGATNASDADPNPIPPHYDIIKTSGKGKGKERQRSDGSIGAANGNGAQLSPLRTSPIWNP